MKHFPKPKDAPPRCLWFYNEKTFKFYSEIDNFKTPEEALARVNKLKESHWRYLWLDDLKTKGTKR